MPLPVSSHPFAELVKTIEFDEKYLELIEVVSGRKREVGSVDEFNRLR